jgi:hypothetical protein
MLNHGRPCHPDCSAPDHPKRQDLELERSVRTRQPTYGQKERKKDRDHRGEWYPRSTATSTARVREGDLSGQASHVGADLRTAALRTRPSGPVTIIKADFQSGQASRRLTQNSRSEPSHPSEADRSLVTPPTTGASPGAVSATPADGDGPPPVGVAGTGLERLANNTCDRQTGNSPGLAPPRLPPVLDVEEPAADRSAARALRCALADSDDVAGQPAVGRSANPRRVTETRH